MKCDFYCDKCQREIELDFNKWESSEETQYCRDCGNPIEKKFPKKTGFILNGNGFHKNDYPKKGNEK